MNFNSPFNQNHFIIKYPISPVKTLMGVATAMDGSVNIEQRELQELRERADRFQSIFANSTLGIFQSSREGRFLMVNAAFAGILGYDDPDDLKKSIRDIENQFYRHAARRAEILSIAVQFRNTCWKASFLATEKGPLPGPPWIRAAIWTWPTEALCFWTRLENCAWTCRSSC